VNRRQRAIVIGGSLGGLFAANMLNARGWHVDVYDDILKDIVIAEIELTQPDQDLQIPDWVGAEVTDDPRYRKVNMRAERLANQRF